MLSTLRAENPALADQFIAPIIPQWLEAYVVILNHHVQNDPKRATEEYGLKMKVVKCICTISSEFPKYISANLPALFEPIWMDLYNLRERYVAEFISDSGDIGETYADSDGNEIGFQNLLYVLFDFVAAACNKKTVRQLFIDDNGSTAFFEQLLYVYIIYMQITQEQVEMWSMDANQYVADEEDGTYTFNARVASIDVLLSLQEAFPLPFFRALTGAVQRHIAESNEARAAGSGDWWKIQEACLLAVGRLSEELTEALGDPSKNVTFDLKSLFDHVVLEDMKAQGMKSVYNNYNRYFKLFYCRISFLTRSRLCICIRICQDFTNRDGQSVCLCSCSCPSSTHRRYSSQDLRLESIKQLL